MQPTKLEPLKEGTLEDPSDQKNIETEYTDRLNEKRVDVFQNLLKYSSFLYFISALYQQIIDSDLSIRLSDVIIISWGLSLYFVLGYLKKRKRFGTIDFWISAHNLTIVYSYLNVRKPQEETLEEFQGTMPEFISFKFSQGLMLGIYAFFPIFLMRKCFWQRVYIWVFIALVYLSIQPDTSHVASMGDVF